VLKSPRQPGFGGNEALSRSCSDGAPYCNMMLMTWTVKGDGELRAEGAD
jgi:hypothetical protein